jgi:hypothetical protein
MWKTEVGVRQERLPRGELRLAEGDWDDVRAFDCELGACVGAAFHAWV